MITAQRSCLGQLAGELSGRPGEELPAFLGHALAHVHHEEHRNGQVLQRDQPDVPPNASSSSTKSARSDPRWGGSAG